MSLLMEALRRAEKQKRQEDAVGNDRPARAVLTPSPAQNTAAMNEQTAKTTASTSLELKLEPIAAPAERSEAKPTSSASDEQRLPDLSQRLAELDEQFLAHAAQARTVGRSAAQTGSERSAQASPAANVASASPSPSTPRSTVTPTARATTGTGPATAQLMFDVKRFVPRRSVVSIAAGVGLIAALAVGAYFWWQLRATAGSAYRLTLSTPTGNPPAPDPPPFAATPAKSLAAAHNEAVPVVVTSSNAVPQDEEEPPAINESLRPTTSHGSFRSTTTIAQPRVRPHSEPLAPIQAAPHSPSSAENPSTASPPLLLITPGVSANDPARQAHEAYLRGDHERAEALWRVLLQTDPRQRDALHGLALLALRRQQPALAADYYRQALEADPRDAPAFAGLLALHGQVDPRLAESRLKSRLTEQPDSPHLNFALGNLLAQEARWAEAQQAYFNAHAADPNHPDILLNLAVSLDHLRQLALAARYYRQALAAAADQPVGFDRKAVEARLKQLTGEER